MLLSACRERREPINLESDAAMGATATEADSPHNQTSESRRASNSAQWTPILSWAGQNAFGYVRAELCVDRSGSPTASQELRIVQADGVVRRHRGRMIEIPGDLVAGGPWRGFVCFDGIGANYPRTYPDFLAAVNPAGVLRLYEFSAANGSGASDLEPLR